MLAAALLHDVGKVDSGFGPVGGRRPRSPGWPGGTRRPPTGAPRGGVVGRTGRYLCHADIGADMLASVGSDGLTVTWAREHHLPPDRWSVPDDIGAALKLADDD